MSDSKQPALGHGKICYVELPAIDIDRSAAFYKAVFGWESRRRGDGSIAFDDGVGQVSGTWVLDRKPSTEIGLLVHIMVDNAEATIQSVLAHGGKLVRPIGHDAPEITARISDPAGNILGIYQHRG